MGAVNVIYCRGMDITIAGSKEQPCPDTAFTLSVKQSFAVGNYNFSGNEMTIDASHEVSMHIQNKINTQLHPGLNPYEVTVTSDQVYLTTELSRSRGTGGWQTTVISLLALALLILMLFGLRGKIRHLIKCESTGEASAPSADLTVRL